MAWVKRFLDGREVGLRWFSCFTVLLALACAHAPRPPCDNPPPLYLVLKGSDRLNPDEKGRPLVTQVLILQVKGTAKLEGADFSELTTKPKEVLGDELLSMNETTVEPSGTTTVGYRRDPKATAVVVVANFRQPSGLSWRTAARASRRWMWISVRTSPSHRKMHPVQWTPFSPFHSRMSVS